MHPIIKNYLTQKLGTDQYHIQPVGGGCINQTICIKTNHQQFFCKINTASKFPQMFAKEKSGLELIARHNIIKVPRVVDYAIIGDQQVLMLEWINTGTKTQNFWKTFGQQLAQLHQVSSDLFGLEEDNFMGSVPQVNQQEEAWIIFFTKHRLMRLVNLCMADGLLTSKHQTQFEQLYNKLPQIFSPEKPSLVHGDLWSGNYMCDDHSHPVLIDPAVYYGHRSVDLGMTTLFGGFDRSFYEAYHYYYPLPSNFQEQRDVCNLYPLLIHLLLFGKSYLLQIESILKSYQ